MEGPTQHYSGIGWAIKQMRDGSHLRRRGWGTRGAEFVAFVPKGSVAIPHKFGAGNDTGPFLVVKLPNRGLVPWTATQADLLSDDWELVHASSSAGTAEQTS